MKLLLTTAVLLAGCVTLEGYFDTDGDGVEDFDDCQPLDPEMYDADEDGDGWNRCDGDCDDTDAAMNLDDADGDGASTCDGDCADEDPAVFPGAPDYDADAIDSDCDPSTEGAPTEHVEGDGDPYDNIPYENYGLAAGGPFAEFDLPDLGLLPVHLWTTVTGNLSSGFTDSWEGDNDAFRFRVPRDEQLGVAIHWATGGGDLDAQLVCEFEDALNPLDWYVMPIAYGSLTSLAKPESGHTSLPLSAGAECVLIVISHMEAPTEYTVFLGQDSAYYANSGWPDAPYPD